MICSICKREIATKKDRLPSGWKRLNDVVYCDLCWRKRYILRAVAFPIAEIMDGSKDDFYAELRAAWGQTTNCSNWMMTELYTRDEKRNGQEKMPKMPAVYLYPDARQRFAKLPPTTVAALEQQVKAKYRKRRFEIIWTSASSLPTFRYPTPLPVPNQAWSCWFEKNRPHVSVRIAERRWQLRLKGGSQFRRQLAAFKLIASGDAVQGELDLYRVRDSDGKPERNVTQRVRFKTMVKLVAWLPRQPVSNSRLNVLTVRTGPNSLLVAFNPNEDKLWNYHADHIRRFIAEHKRQLQRWSDDQKYENRPVPTFAEHRKLDAERYRRRMHSEIEQIAASLAGYAHRRHSTVVRYDDTDVSYCPEFPWGALGSRIAVKLDEIGITLEVASAKVVEEIPEPLAEDVTT